MFDELLSLCPTHLKSWLVDFVDACPTLPPTYSELVDLIMDSIKESISPDVAWSSLLAHKQGSLSVADYAERFRLLAETAKASEDVQPILFRQGLSQATQQLLLAVPPSCNLEQEVLVASGVLQRQKVLLSSSSRSSNSSSSLFMANKENSSNYLFSISITL